MVDPAPVIGFDKRSAERIGDVVRKVERHADTTRPPTQKRPADVPFCGVLLTDLGPTVPAHCAVLHPVRASTVWDIVLRGHVSEFASFRLLIDRPKRNRVEVVVETIDTAEAVAKKIQRATGLEPDRVGVSLGRRGPRPTRDKFGRLEIPENFYWPGRWLVAFHESISSTIKLSTAVGPDEDADGNAYKDQRAFVAAAERSPSNLYANGTIERVRQIIPIAFPIASTDGRYPDAPPLTLPTGTWVRCERDQAIDAWAVTQFEARSLVTEWLPPAIIGGQTA